MWHQYKHVQTFASPDLTACSDDQYIFEHEKICINCPNNSNIVRALPGSAHTLDDCHCLTGFIGSPSKKVTCEGKIRVSALLGNCVHCLQALNHIFVIKTNENIHAYFSILYHCIIKDSEPH